MATTNFNLRLEQELRDRAFLVFERYGLSASQAFKLFLNQVAETNKIPLSFDYAEKELIHSAETGLEVKENSECYRADKL